MSRCATCPLETWRKRNACARSRGLPQGLRITTHAADVSDEAQVQRFRDEVAERQETDKIHLLFNNAGIGGGGSMFANSREEWERTFNICWRGVYYNTRAFLPMLQRGRQRPHHQHQQRQRLLGLARATHPAHRLCRGEVRGQGLFRSANHRFANQCASHQVLRSNAGAYRDVDRRQLTQDPEWQRVG